MTTDEKSQISTAPIDMKDVESSQIARIGHDPATNTLAVQFKSRGAPGSVYHYANVTPELFGAFDAAKSKGTFFGAHIKPAVEEYPFQKITPAQAPTKGE